MKRIVIHCSDTPNGREHTAADIHRWHRKKGWHGIGYHYVIRVDGTVERGRPEYWQGSHVFGHNQDSLGVLMMGTDEFSDAQWDSLGWLVRDLTARYPEADVEGHRDLDPSKECPCFDAGKWWANYQEEIARDEQR